ncbi:MAG: PIN domain-containing protein [Candidatus Altiarchaeales archaeon]|nr:PIN domain-containing protein [Candidatus Altiarchaeales archaeon]MBD3416986.1 PIN domain-containing protein [Candidatus Altiarchaeales archaeon]
MMTECLDASVIVKWFKEDEPDRDKSKILYQRIENFEADFITNEWTLLEVTRALSKSKYKKEEIEEANSILKDLRTLGAIKILSVSSVIDLSQKLEVDLDLYASDAVHIATAIHTTSNIFWSEDQHHHKTKVKQELQKHNIEIKRLKEVG